VLSFYLLLRHFEAIPRCCLSNISKDCEFLNIIAFEIHLNCIKHVEKTNLISADPLISAEVAFDKGIT